MWRMGCRIETCCRCNAIGSVKVWLRRESGLLSWSDSIAGRVPRDGFITTTTQQKTSHTSGYRRMKPHQIPQRKRPLPGGDDLHRMHHDVRKLFIGDVFILCESLVTTDAVRNIKVIHMAAPNSSLVAPKALLILNKPSRTSPVASIRHPRLVPAGLLPS